MSTRILDHQPVTTYDREAALRSARLEALLPRELGAALETMLACMDLLDDRVRIILERDGSVLAAGQHTERWIAQSDCLSLDGGKLRITCGHGPERLGDLLRVATGAIDSLIVERHSGRGHCILRAAGLCDQAVALTMQLAHEGFEPKLADLESAFGLTPAEIHIVELLQDGRGPQEIGDALGISVHTVRAHLRHCYDKLDVSSREGLWQRLAPYRLN